MSYSDLSEDDVKGAMECIMVIKEKRDGRIKGRAVADGRKQERTMSTHSPTVSIEGLSISLTIDAKEERHVAVCDIVGAYLNADMEDKVIMIFRGNMADYMIQINPKRYAKSVHVQPDGTKVLYVRLRKALYGCIQSALLWWRMLSTTLMDQGFKYIYI